MAICSKLKRIGFVEAVVTMTIYLKRKRKRIICVANGQTNLLMKKMGLMEKIILGFQYDFQLLCPSKAIFYLLILCQRSLRDLKLMGFLVGKAKKEKEKKENGVLSRFVQLFNQTNDKKLRGKPKEQSLSLRVLDLLLPYCHGIMM